MPAQTRLLLLFGGVSSEHEVSVRSAASILAAVDRQIYHPILVGIRRDGTWHTGEPDQPLAEIIAHGPLVADLRALEADVVFPVLHGPHGEDGTIAGLMEILGLPYVGSGVLAAALCMDKQAQRHMIHAAAPHIPMVPWRSVRAHRLSDAAMTSKLVDELVHELGLPCFVKPANMGSSVGVAKVTTSAQLLPALRNAAKYDDLLLVERGIDAREIEVAVLGDGGAETIVSAPGEILLPPGVWYDYDTKYISDIASTTDLADLTAEQAANIRTLALDAFVATGCHGLARIDFLLDRTTDMAYLNELNTMPGFTSISMYPKLMAKAGVPYPELIGRLCELARARHRRRQGLSVHR